MISGKAYIKKSGEDCAYCYSKHLILVLMLLHLMELWRLEEDIVLLQCVLRNKGQEHWVWWKQKRPACWVHCSSYNAVMLFYIKSLILKAVLEVCTVINCCFELLVYGFSQRGKIRWWMGLLWATWEEVSKTESWYSQYCRDQSQKQSLPGNLLRLMLQLLWLRLQCHFVTEYVCWVWNICLKSQCNKEA